MAKFLSIDKDSEGNRIEYLHQLYFLENCEEVAFSEIQKKELIRIMKRVFVTELTNRQQECVLLVKGENKTQKSVAKYLGISESSVSRHLKAAQKKFDRAYSYFTKFERPQIIRGNYNA